MRAWVGILLCGALAAEPHPAANRVPQLTPAAAGPYRIEGNRILDGKGRPYLIRGTRMTPIRPAEKAGAGANSPFDPHSRTSLITLRQRMNMNAVRLPVSAREFLEQAGYRARARQVVDAANSLELAVVLEEEGASETAVRVAFWTRCALEFRDNPNVFFAPGYMQALVDAIRSTGARQPVIARAGGGTPEGPEAGIPLKDRNVIYEVTPRYEATRTDEDRRRQFGLLAARAPVLADGLDPELDRDSRECASFPGDPAAATQRVLNDLRYFDANSISWTISSFVPGRLITDYRYYNWTKLDDGWTCGAPFAGAGIALVVLSHLWNADPHGLFPVSQTTGSFRMARGSVCSVYGPILADRERAALPNLVETALGNVSVLVTDSRGDGRLAQLLATGAGWSYLNFVVPPDAAEGPAEVAVVRSDGSRSRAGIIITGVAPGFWTATNDARGPAIGKATVRLADGRRAVTPLSECSRAGCRTVPIPMTPGAETTVRLDASGLRNAGPKAVLQVTVDGAAVPVLSFGSAEGPGRDQLTIQLPGTLSGRGEVDLTARVNGELSNVVRIRIGGPG